MNAVAPVTIEIRPDLEERGTYQVYLIANDGEVPLDGSYLSIDDALQAVAATFTPPAADTADRLKAAEEISGQVQDLMDTVRELAETVQGLHQGLATANMKVEILMQLLGQAIGGGGGGAGYVPGRPTRQESIGAHPAPGAGGLPDGAGRPARRVIQPRTAERPGGMDRALAEPHKPIGGVVRGPGSSGPILGEAAPDEEEV